MTATIKSLFRLFNISQQFRCLIHRGWLYFSFFSPLYRARHTRLWGGWLGLCDKRQACSLCALKIILDNCSSRVWLYLGGKSKKFGADGNEIIDSSLGAPASFIAFSFYLRSLSVKAEAKIFWLKREGISLLTPDRRKEDRHDEAIKIVAD